jgi:hypothetical protein
MKTTIQFIFLFFVNFLLVSFVYGQDNLDSLESVRMTQALNNENYIPIDKQIVEKGYKPKALSYLIESETEKEYQFLTYKNYKAEKLELIYSRLQVLYPELISITINGNQVLASFSKEVAEESLLTFFRFFGYQNYELLSH